MCCDPPAGAGRDPTKGQGLRGLRFVFAGDDGACLGGMQDYYGTYGSTAAAMRAAPADAHWAEIAALRDGRLVMVATGRRRGPTWEWEDLDGSCVTAPDRLQDVA